MTKTALHGKSHLFLLNPDEEEIRWKYSTLHIAIGDLERLKDDLNYVVSDKEFRSFIPYDFF
jgi:hypothetical protein